MSKGKYIKVTDANNKSSVVMATNEAFYKSQGYQISEPTQEEIEEYFPSARVATAPVQKVDTSGVESELQQVRTDLEKEKEDHAETANKLKVEQGHHADTKEALDSAKSELQQVRTDLETTHGQFEASKSQYEFELDKLQKELDKLKKKA